MALERTFRDLSERLMRLRDRLRELRLSVVEDRPPKRDGAVVDHFEYAVEDVLGWLEETIEAAGLAGRAVSPPVDLEAARTNLALCQERFHRITNCFTASLMSYQRISELTSFGRERRGEWPSWVTSVRLGIEHCGPPLEEAGKALAECWQEIAERVGSTSVSIRTENVGQKVCNGDEKGSTHGSLAATESQANQVRRAAHAAESGGD